MCCSGESIGWISSLDEPCTAVEADSILKSRVWEGEVVAGWEGFVIRSVESSSRRVRSVGECLLGRLSPRMLRTMEVMKSIVILLLRSGFEDGWGCFGLLVGWEAGGFVYLIYDSGASWIGLGQGVCSEMAAGWMYFGLDAWVRSTAALSTAYAFTWRTALRGCCHRVGAI